MLLRRSLLQLAAGAACIIVTAAAPMEQDATAAVAGPTEQASKAAPKEGVLRRSRRTPFSLPSLPSLPFFNLANFRNPLKFNPYNQITILPFNVFGTRVFLLPTPVRPRVIPFIDVEITGPQLLYDLLDDYIYPLQDKRAELEKRFKIPNPGNWFKAPGVP